VRHYFESVPEVPIRMSPEQQLWLAVLLRAWEDLSLWSQRKRLMKITQDGASPVTGLCSVDAYLSTMLFICDETRDGVTFTQVCHGLGLDTDATFERFVALLPRDRRMDARERRRRQLLKRDG
jgi:hypothetical protein